MSLETPPLQQAIIDQKTSMMSREWAVWFTKLWTVSTNINSSGTTADRPTTGLYIGMTYFDTTIGRPIWLQAANPPAWIRADGVFV